MTKPCKPQVMTSVLSGSHRPTLRVEGSTRGCDHQEAGVTGGHLKAADHSVLRGKVYVFLLILSF